MMGGSGRSRARAASARPGEVFRRRPGRGLRSIRALGDGPGGESVESAEQEGPSRASSSVDSTLASLDLLLGGGSVEDDREKASVGGASASNDAAPAADPASSTSSAPASETDQALSIPTVQPRLTYALLALNLTVYGVGVGIALAGDAEASNEYFLALAKDNAAVIGNGEYYRLLSANFMHAGLLHLGLNCAALIALGPEAEAVLGYDRFLFIYLSSGLSGSLASLLFSESVTVGASGALLGLLGALMAYFLRNPTLSRANWQLGFLAVTAALNLGIGLDGDGLVDNTGHVAGLLTGLALGLGMGPRWEARREPHDDDDAKQEQSYQLGPTTAMDATPQAQKLAVACSFSGLLLLALAFALLGEEPGTNMMP